MDVNALEPTLQGVHLGEITLPRRQRCWKDRALPRYLPLTSLRPSKPLLKRLPRLRLPNLLTTHSCLIPPSTYSRTFFRWPLSHLFVTYSPAQPHQPPHPYPAPPNPSHPRQAVQNANDYASNQPSEFPTLETDTCPLPRTVICYARAHFRHRDRSRRLRCKSLLGRPPFLSVNDKEKRRGTDFKK